MKSNLLTFVGLSLIASTVAYAENGSHFSFAGQSGKTGRVTLVSDSLPSTSRGMTEQEAKLLAAIDKLIGSLGSNEGLKDTSYDILYNFLEDPTKQEWLENYKKYIGTTGGDELVAEMTAAGEKADNKFQRGMAFVLSVLEEKAKNSNDPRVKNLISLMQNHRDHYKGLIKSYFVKKAESLKGKPKLTASDLTNDICVACSTDFDLETPIKKANLWSDAKPTQVAASGKTPAKTETQTNTREVPQAKLVTGPVTEVSSAGNQGELLQELLDDPNVQFVVMNSGDPAHCPPCRQMEPVLEAVGRRADVKVLHINSSTARGAFDNNIASGISRRGKIPQNAILRRNADNTWWEVIIPAREGGMSQQSLEALIRSAGR